MSTQFVLKILLLVVALLVTGCIVDPGQGLQSPGIPEELMVSASEKVVMSMFAEGVQIYHCKPKQNDATKLEWVFQAPEALLYDSEHNEAGTHYGGPTWEASDGSKVVAEVKARADAPSADAIPWLLLTTKSTEGTGAFSHVTSIQRVETTGGKAPQNGCDATHQDKEAQVPYTARYVFYTSSMPSSENMPIDARSLGKK